VKKNANVLKECSRTQIVLTEWLVLPLPITDRSLTPRTYLDGFHISFVSAVVHLTRYGGPGCRHTGHEHSLCTAFNTNYGLTQTLCFYPGNKTQHCRSWLFQTNKEAC